MLRWTTITYDTILADTETLAPGLDVRSLDGPSERGPQTASFFRTARDFAEFSVQHLRK